MPSGIFLISFYLDFPTRGSPKLLAWFLFSTSQSSAFYLCWNFWLKVNIFLPCSGNLKGHKCQKMLVVLTCLAIQTHISSALPASLFYQGVTFYDSFRNIIKLVLIIEITILVGPMFWKCYEYRDILIF